MGKRNDKTLNQRSASPIYLYSEKNSKKEKKIFKLLIKYFLLCFSIFLIVLSIYLFFSRPLRIETINVKFEVGEKLGVDITTKELNFGILKPGGSALRNLLVKNDYEFPVLIRVLVSKNIQNFLYSEPSFIVEGGDEIKIPIKVIIPSDVKLGNYTGEIKIIFKKKKLYG